MTDSIGILIGKLRTAKNETQQELADALGVSRELVKFWEADQRQIKAEQLRALAEHFHVTADFLLGFTNDPSPHPSAVDTLHLESAAVEQLVANNSNPYTPEIAKVCSSILESIQFWKIVQNVVELQYYSNPRTLQNNEDMAIDAKRRAEVQFNATSGGFKGTLLYGQGYVDHLHTENMLFLRKIVDTILDPKGGVTPCRK